MNKIAIFIINAKIATAVKKKRKKKMALKFHSHFIDHDNIKCFRVTSQAFNAISSRGHFSSLELITKKIMYNAAI